MSTIDLRHCDGLDLLKSMPNKSIDLVLVDPPFQISKDSGMQRAIESGVITNAKYSKTNFGDWDKNFSISDFEPFLKEYHRVLRDGGSIIVFYDLWKISYLKTALESLNFSKLRFIEWLKTNPVPVNQSVTYLSNCREIAISAVKGSKATFNSKYDNGLYQYPIYQDSLVGRIHPTQKSLQLIKELIRKHSNPGDTVMDTFSGSGTCAIACLQEGRNFIGSELDRNYYDASVDRVQKYQSLAAQTK